MDTTSEPARREVTPLELFFDLVFVFAIGQLSHQLLAHPTWAGAAQTLVLYLAVYAAWALRLPKTSSVLVRPCHQHQPCRRIRSGISTAG